MDNDETVQEFLKRIGPRNLNDAEARYLHFLRLKDGHSGNTRFIDVLAKRRPGERLADVKTSENWPCPDEPENEPPAGSSNRIATENIGRSCSGAFGDLQRETRRVPSGPPCATARKPSYSRHAGGTRFLTDGLDLLIEKWEVS
jgi:hypothetical protein